MLKTGHLNSGRVHFCIELIIVGMLPAKLDVRSHVSVFSYLRKSAQNEIRNLEALCPIPMRICNLSVRTHPTQRPAHPFPLCAAEEWEAEDRSPPHPKRPIRRYLLLCAGYRSASRRRMHEVGEGAMEVLERHLFNHCANRAASNAG